jgi:ankyrin repeat protein
MESEKLYDAYLREIQNLKLTGLLPSKIFQGLNSEPARILAQRFSKPLSNNPELIEMSILHLLAIEALDTEKEMLELLGKVLEVMGESGILEGLNKAQRTPLMVACRHGNLEAAKLLIDQGANCKISTATGTPVIMAVESGRSDLL